MRKSAINDNDGGLGELPESLFFFSLGTRAFLFFLSKKKKRNTLENAIISAIDMKRKKVIISATDMKRNTIISAIDMMRKLHEV